MVRLETVILSCHLPFALLLCIICALIIIQVPRETPCATCTRHGAHVQPAHIHPTAMQNVGGGTDRQTHSCAHNDRVGMNICTILRRQENTSVVDTLKDDTIKKYTVVGNLKWQL